jgi:hypothetical protein
MHPIADHIESGSVEDRRAHARQLDVKARPRLRLIHSLEPRPSTTKGEIQKFEIQEAQAAQTLGESHLIPRHKAMPAIDLLPPFPHKGSANL